MLRSFKLLEENKDPAEGGTGGGGAAAATFTEAQQGEIAKIVNSAVSSHLKRGLAPAIGEALKTVNWAETLKLDETLEAKLAKLKEAAPPGGTDPNAVNQPPKVDPQVAALTAKVQELTQNIQRQQDEVKAAKEQARNEKAFADLKSALGGQVRPEALDIAARDLFLAQKRVTFDEQGNPLFTVKKAPYAGAAEEDVPMPLTDGVSHWLKSEEGKFFLPAPTAGTQNAGRVPPGPRNQQQQRSAGGVPKYDTPATTDAEKIRRAEEQTAAILAKYPHLTNPSL